MADLDFTLTQLESLVHDLRVIKSNFDNADRFSDEVADAVGHERLASRVRDFAGQWNDKRSALADRVQSMATAVDTIHDSFITVDMELSDAATVAEGARPHTKDNR